MQYDTLPHVRKPIFGDGHGLVLVLDTGALIGADAEAMLQALHSRSIGGIDAHLVRLAQKGAKEFMETYYVGYGDKSIGDCGTATIFIEGVSMLAAKAIQDFPLYNGQESSTRYIDFSKQPFADPSNSATGQDLLWELRQFHLKGLERMKEELKKRHPRQEGEEEKIWEKAIKARAFDVMRSFLPAGAATNLSWHGEIRQLNDHLGRLRNHPLEEVRQIAGVALQALIEKYPSAFTSKLYPETEKYTRNWMEKEYYFDANMGDVTLEWDGIDRTLLSQYGGLFANRPIKTDLPKFIAECGTVRFSYLLDFASFRDQQRHRALIQRMPLLTDAHGFEEWYLEQMPEDLTLEAAAFLGGYESRIAKLGLSPLMKQYMLPMGYKVACRNTGDIPAYIWFVELRSKLDVHPTLRVKAQKVGRILLDEFGMLGLTMHIDTSSDRFNYKRGHQDIVEKQPALLQ
jgi:thymidylate synthase ThyX